MVRSEQLVQCKTGDTTLLSVLAVFNDADEVRNARFIHDHAVEVTTTLCQIDDVLRHHFSDNAD